MVPCVGRRVLRLNRAVLFLCIAIAACAPKFERPDLSVVSVNVQHANFLQQTFLVKFQVQNPNNRAIPVQGLKADLAVGGQHVASGVSNQPFVVPPMGQSEFDMTITANTAAVLLALSTQHSDSIAYEVTGSASLDLPFLHDLPFHQVGSLSLQSLR